MCVGQQPGCSAWRWRRDSASHSQPNPLSRLPPVGHRTGAAAAKSRVRTTLPNPAEDKRRALRSEAITQILNGEATPQQVNGSTVVKRQGERRTRPRLPARPGQKAARRQTKDQYVELTREKTDQIFVILAEFGNERHPSYPDQDTNPASRARPASTARCTTRSPSPTARSTTRRSGRPTTAPSTTGSSTSARARRRVAEDLLRGAVLGPLQRRRQGHRLGQGAVQRGPLRPQPTASRAPRNVCSNTWDLVRDAANQWVADQQAAGPHRRADQRRPGLVRPVGPLRLRRRRRLQRARRLHRPLPDRARRRRPGRR